MTDFRKDIYDRLKTLPYNVYMERVDPIKADKFPFINVQYNDIERRLIGHDFTFQVDAKVIITIAHNGTVENTPQKVHDIANECLNKLLKDSDWRSFNFEYLKNFTTRYGTISRNEAAGEANLTVANITFDFQETERYIPEFINDYTKAYIDIDFISPFDQSIATTGPDKQIEASIVVNIPQ